MSALRCGLVFVLASGFSALPVRTHADDKSVDWNARGDEVVRLVREHFYDRNLADAWATKYAGYAATIDNALQFSNQTKQILKELNASHTAYHTNRELEFFGLSAIFAAAQGKPPIEYDSIGVDFTPDLVARVVFAGGPAAKAGLHRGDKILRVDGRKFHPIESLRGRAGKTVTLSVQRERDEPSFELALQPRRVDPKREWLDAQREGTRIIATNGKSIGYVPMFACAGEEYQHALHEAIRERIAAADALIVDFRNGWGGCTPDLVNLFNRTPAVLTMIGRDGQRNRIDTQWRKPLFVLINSGSRSGKEVVAHSVKRHRLGTLVGEKTGGAVLGGRVFALPNDSLLYLAVTDIEVDGERLEGRGVEPDVAVADALPFANGKDPQLEKALELAGR
jgi:carboxyl-terminal processing protease